MSDPMDSGVDCPECEGTGAVDVDCETGYKIEAAPAWMNRKEPSRRTLLRWAREGIRRWKPIMTNQPLKDL